MYKIKMLIEDYETKETMAAEREFENIEEAQTYVDDCNLNDLLSVIRCANVYLNAEYVGNISQNGRYWSKDSKYGCEVDI